ncbi:MAG: segregation/condensation protein A [Robiginitomaculum sp.]|nr:MAG: segregation/condensation protein A [Robiginitomaculum sp.]
MSISDFEEDLPFEAARQALGENTPLIVDLDGFEGPLHVLLELARKQKVDLRNISILELADQYLSFIERIKDVRIELAADYLVMASWLAYLKSRLLLPVPQKDGEEPSGEEMAVRLAFRLRRLHAMRMASKALMNQNRTGINIFTRGAPEGVRRVTSPVYEAGIYDLLKAYAVRRSRVARAHLTMKTPIVYALEEARERLERILGKIHEWTALDALLPKGIKAGANKPPRSSILASSLVASLELAKEGKAELRQSGAFTPLYVRACSGKDVGAGS